MIRSSSNDQPGQQDRREHHQHSHDHQRFYQSQRSISASAESETVRFHGIANRVRFVPVSASAFRTSAVVYTCTLPSVDSTFPRLTCISCVQSTGPFVVSS